jgi:large subunit ribosomal protein L30e
VAPSFFILPSNDRQLNQELIGGMVKKAQAENVNTKLGLVMRRGKAVLGYKSTMKSLRNGKAKLILIANNCPTLRKSQIEYYAMLANIEILLYPGSNIDLGKF